MVVTRLLGKDTSYNTGKEMSRQASTRGNEKLELKNVKCFGCHKKGHVVSECPDKKKTESSRLIQTESTTHSISTNATAIDLWIRVLMLRITT